MFQIGGLGSSVYTNDVCFCMRNIIWKINAFRVSRSRCDFFFLLRGGAILWFSLLFCDPTTTGIVHQALVFTLLEILSVLLWSSSRTVGFTRETARLLLRKDLAHVKVYVVRASSMDNLFV